MRFSLPPVGARRAGQTQAVVGPFAAPVHGTFWVSAPTTAGLGSVIARQVKVKGETVEAREVGGLLRANVGRKVWIWATQDTEAPIIGTIFSFAPDRPREAVRRYGGPFGRVTLQGALRVTDYKSEAIRLGIKKTLSGGGVKATAPTPKITTLAAGLKRMNQVHALTWRVDLAAREPRRSPIPTRR